MRGSRYASQIQRAPPRNSPSAALPDPSAKYARANGGKKKQTLFRGDFPSDNVVTYLERKLIWNFEARVEQYTYIYIVLRSTVRIHANVLGAIKTYTRARYFILATFDARKRYINDYSNIDNASRLNFFLNNLRLTVHNTKYGTEGPTFDETALLFGRVRIPPFARSVEFRNGCSGRGASSRGRVIENIFSKAETN